MCQTRWRGDETGLWEGLSVGLRFRGLGKLKLTGLTDSVIHRADYLDMLLEKAQSLGVNIRLGAEVVDVRTATPSRVTLTDGCEIEADVIVGADGKFSFSYLFCGSRLQITSASLDRTMLG